ncbi:MAG: TolC family protein [Limnobacter sp.]|nr:TolC family protein [Limnobacter sp.]
MRTHRCLGLFAFLLALPVLAAPGDYPAELPPIEQVRAAIDDSPEVRAALALGQASLAERRQLASGPHEWSTRVDYQRRRADETSGRARFNEWEVSLERPLRLPGKAQLDRRLGDQRVAEASVALADARHEASKRLLTLWYQWLREHDAAEVLRSQAELGARELAGIARRRQLGDASRLEALQAQAAATQAEAAARLASERVRRTELVLREQFPQVSPPANPARPAPGLPGFDLAALAESAMQEDPGLRLARAAALRSRLESERADAERRADPTVGVRYGAERGGNERIIGVYVSIPIGGEARRAAADANRARADTFEHLADARLRRMSGEIRSLRSAVESDVSRWQVAEQAAQAQAQVAERVAKANQLGETGLAEVLLARRQALEALLSASSARVDALENRSLLLLGAGRLWNSGPDD